MSMMTLREVCGATGVTRRAIQGYERAGLVASSGKNGRGYLLYDSQAREKIIKVKLYQDMGFTIKEIMELEHVPNHVLRTALEVRLERLLEEQVRIGDMVLVIRDMIDKL